LRGPDPDTVPSFIINTRLMIHSLRSLCLGIAILTLTVQAGTLLGQSPATGPRLTFTKTLKGSTPEYFALKIDAHGKGTYDAHKLEDPSTIRQLQISTKTTNQIFSLVQSLNYFRGGDLDSHRKVANMGMKTLIYEDVGESNTAQFNYSDNRFAQQLDDLLEKIGNVEERIAQLDYAMKYDRLNLPHILAQIEYGMENDYFAEADMMLPTLEKISNDPHCLHLAQTRAREVADRIRKGK
jgi:hypothetical protein